MDTNLHEEMSPEERKFRRIVSMSSLAIVCALITLTVVVAFGSYHFGEDQREFAKTTEATHLMPERLSDLEGQLAQSKAETSDTKAKLFEAEEKLKGELAEDKIRNSASNLQSRTTNFDAVETSPAPEWTFDELRQKLQTKSPSAVMDLLGNPKTVSDYPDSKVWTYSGIAYDSAMDRVSRFTMIMFKCFGRDGFKACYVDRVSF